MLEGGVDMAEITKEQTPMKEVEESLETLNSCAVSLEELVISCHTHLLGEFEFHPIPDEASQGISGQLSSISAQIRGTRRQIQRCIEVMQSMQNNIS